MSEIQPIDESEVFYQAKHKTAEIWHLCSEEDFSDFLKLSYMDVRMLWTTRAVLNRISTAVKHLKIAHKLDYQALQKENKKLRFKAMAAISPRLKQSYEREIKGLEDKIEEQANRIFDLEKTWTDKGKLHATLLKLGYDRGLALHIAGATDYDRVKEDLEEVNALYHELKAKSEIDARTIEALKAKLVKINAGEA